MAAKEVLLLQVQKNFLFSYSTGFQYIEKINITAPQPQCNVLKYFAIFKNVLHSLEPVETTSYSASHQAPNHVQRSFLKKNDEITANFVNLIMTSTVINGPV